MMFFKEENKMAFPEYRSALTGSAIQSTNTNFLELTLTSETPTIQLEYSFQNPSTLYPICQTILVIPPIPLTSDYPAWEVRMPDATFASTPLNILMTSPIVNVPDPSLVSAQNTTVNTPLTLKTGDFFTVGRKLVFSSESDFDTCTFTIIGTNELSAPITETFVFPTVTASASKSTVNLFKSVTSITPNTTESLSKKIRVTVSFNSLVAIRICKYAPLGSPAELIALLQPAESSPFQSGGMIFILTDNGTQGGTWRTVALGAQAPTPASWAGYGLKYLDNNALNINMKPIFITEGTEYRQTLDDNGICTEIGTLSVISSGDLNYFLQSSEAQKKGATFSILNIGTGLVTVYSLNNKNTWNGPSILEEGNLKINPGESIVVTADGMNGFYISNRPAIVSTVTGPVSSVVGDIVIWNSLDGKTIKDAGFNIAKPTPSDKGKFLQVNDSLNYIPVPNSNGNVVGPYSSLSGNNVQFNGLSGKLIKDAGYSIPKPVTGDENKILKVNGEGSNYILSPLPSSGLESRIEMLEASVLALQNNR